MGERELDVRGLAKRDKHPAIFAAFEHPQMWMAFVLVNNHDPKHLREEFETDYPDAYGWAYPEKGPVWPLVVAEMAHVAHRTRAGDRHGVDRTDGAAFAATADRRRRTLGCSTMRRIFRRHRTHLAAVALIAEKPDKLMTD